MGNLTFACVGWGQLNPRSQVSNDFFFRAPKSVTAIKHVFERDGRDIAFVSDWLTKRSSKVGDRQTNPPTRGRGFKRSNLQKFNCPWFSREGGGVMLKFRVDRCIMKDSLTGSVAPTSDADRS